MNIVKEQQESQKIKKINDNIKNIFCEKNNVKLIRIPYTEIKNIKKFLDKTFDDI